MNQVSAMDWGSFPVWVGTLIAGTSALVGVFTYRRSVADKERDQASRVASWFSVESTELTRDNNNPQHYHAVVTVALHVVNRSDAPIYSVRVTWEPPEIRDSDIPGQSRDRNAAELPDGSCLLYTSPSPRDGLLSR